MKICSKCNILRDENLFSKDRCKLKSRCKICDKHYRINNKEIQREYDKQYYLNFKKKIYNENLSSFKERNALYYKENKEKVISKVKEYSKNNKDKLKDSRKKYYENNKEIILEKQKKYYEENINIIKIKKEKYRSSHKFERNKNQKMRYDNEPLFKLRMNLSTAILDFLKMKNSSKNNHSIMEYLPYKIDDLKDHLENQFEPWMNWTNHGKYNSKIWNDNDQTTWTWNIDHITPHSLLPYSSMEDENFNKCWTLSNLRPYSAKQNILDGNRR